MKYEIWERDMDFKRGQPVKEVLKIGRIANAIPIKNFDVWGKIQLPGGFNNMDIDLNTYTVHFGISKKALIGALEILGEGGICREFDDYIHELMKKFFLGNIKDRGISIPFKSHDIIPSLSTVYVKEGFTLTFSMTGKDLLYNNKLYKIAEPRDGY